MDNPDTDNTGYTIHRTKTYKRENTAQKLLAKISNTDPTKNRGGTNVLANGKQFLPLLH